MHDLNYCMPDLNYCMPDLNYCGITAELGESGALRSPGH